VPQLLEVELGLFNVSPQFQPLFC